MRHVIILIGLVAALGLAWAQESEPTEITAPEPEPVRVPITRRLPDQVSIFGGEIRVPADAEVRGDVVSIGGEVFVEGRVRGNVVVITGDLTLTGEVRGTVTGVLSNMETRGAEIGGQLINVAGALDRDSETLVEQGTVNLGLGEGWLSLSKPFGVIGALLFWGRLVRLLVVFVLVLLLVALVPERVRVISEETPNRIFAAFFVGLLGYLAFWIVLVLLLATLVGPFVAWLFFIVLKWLGIAGMFHFLGHRVGRGLGREMSLLGAVLLGFAPYILIVLLPSAFGLAGLIIAMVFGLLIWVFLEIPAVGMVILTRAGSRSAPPLTADFDQSMPVQAVEQDDAAGPRAP